MAGLRLHSSHSYLPMASSAACTCTGHKHQQPSHMQFKDMRASTPAAWLGSGVQDVPVGVAVVHIADGGEESQIQAAWLDLRCEV